MKISEKQLHGLIAYSWQMIQILKKDHGESTRGFEQLLSEIYTQQSKEIREVE